MHTNNVNEHCRGEKGFTLIEVLMALAIFSIGFLALASMQLTATNGNSRARTMSDAASVLEGYIEDLKKVKYTTGEYYAFDVANRDEPYSLYEGDHSDVVQVDNTPSDPSGGIVNYNIDYTVTYIGTSSAGVPPPAIKVDIEVTWTSLAKTRTLEYKFARTRDVM